jgi:CheY-like chemotaxis protein
VLVVDDCPDTTASSEALLRCWGHRALVARCGEDAIALAAEHRPDVVLVDLALPGMTGWELIHRLRASSHSAAARLVVISGFAQESDRRRSQESGCDLHLAKPVEPDDLRQLLSAIEQEIASAIVSTIREPDRPTPAA